MTFVSYEPRTDIQRKALDTVSARHGGYFLFGCWGTGKTHLLVASVIRAVQSDIISAFISAPKLLDTIRKAGRENDSELEVLFHSIPYLAVDDIGKQKDTDWASERLFLLLDERYRLSQAGQCCTSFTSNLPLEKLAEKIDGAIVDRIAGMCKEVFVDGTSYRRLKK
ncbi:MAG: ATP-binding protein [Candidatus Magnetoovum sp. WYHC-5]|nr:ATP-binding protein [Candidatus Magnetoovum sp. WYHC-5]